MKPKTMNDLISRREIVNDCWEWTGSKIEQGYGNVWSDGKLWKVHRLSFILSGGTLGPAQEIDHVCHNRSCFNPAHLRATDHRTNCRSRNNGLKTHCPKGHEYAENTQGIKVCKLCRDERVRAYYASRSDKKLEHSRRYDGSKLLNA